MNKRTNFIALLALVLLALADITSVQAQQEPLYTQFQFNKLAINPAYAGSRGATSFTSLYRHQWQGISDAPRTLSFNVHSALRNPKYALGVQVINDRLGVTNNTGIMVDYAYRLPLGSAAKSTLSFGLEAGVNYYNVALTEAIIHDSGDPNLQANFQKWLPNMGFGMYFSSPRAFAGLSVPRLIQNNLVPDGVVAPIQSKQFRHFYAMGGYVFDLGEFVKFRPSALLKYVQNTPLQAELNGSFLFIDRMWVGGSYRTDGSVDANLEVNITHQLRIGYAYDFVVGELGNYTTGSHELLIGFDLDFERDRMETPRNMGNSVVRYF